MAKKNLRNPVRQAERSDRRGLLRNDAKIELEAGALARSIHAEAAVVRMFDRKITRTLAIERLPQTNRDDVFRDSLDVLRWNRLRARQEIGRNAKQDRATGNEM